MTNASRGALLSGVVFPGLGQVVLKHYIRGIAMMLTVLIGLLVMVVKGVQHALTILDAIQSQGGAIDMDAISIAATRATTTSDSLLFKLLPLWVVFCWIIAVVDAYRSGRKKDVEQSST